MDRSAFATQTGSFDLAVPLCHAKRRPHHRRSPLCTQREGGRDNPVVARVSLLHPTLPRGWCGNSCRCCGSKSWNPPGMVLGSSVEGRLRAHPEGLPDPLCEVQLLGVPLFSAPLPRMPLLYLLLCLQGAPWQREGALLFP